MEIATMRAKCFPASAASLAVLVALTAALSSCGREGGSLGLSVTAPENSPCIDSSWSAARVTRPGFDLRDAEEAIAAHDAALNARDFWLYSHILSPDFEFYPLPSDVLDLPWMDGYSWPLFEELNMIEHLFDPYFSGDAPAVQSINASTEIFTTNEIEPGHIEMTGTMQCTILTKDASGWSVDTGLVFDLVSQGGGGYLIRTITETAAPGRVEGSSWGLIKALSRGVYLP
jgi:hypothetical protein